MGPRPRRMWRRAARVLLGFLALIVLLVVAGFGLLHTDWMRDKVRGILVEQLGKRLNGSVELARLEGDLLDAVTLRGLVVRDSAGKEVARADSLTVDYRLLPLLDSHFHADLIAIDGLQASLRRLPDGRLAVADLWIKQPPSNDAPWTTTLDAIRIERSSVAFERAPGVWDKFQRIDLDGSFAVETDEMLVTLRSLDAEWSGPDVKGGVALAAGGQLRIPQAGGLEFAGVEVSVGSNHLVVPHGRWGEGARSVAFAAEVSSDELARLWRDSPLRADARLTGFVVQDADGQRVRAYVVGGAGAHGSLAASAELGAGASSGTVALFWSGIEPSKLVAAAPDGLVDGWVGGDIAGWSRADSVSIADVRGHVLGGAAGTIHGVKVSKVGFDGELSKRRFTGLVKVDAALGSARANVAALLPEKLDQTGPVALENAELQAEVHDVGDLERALGRPVTTRGAVSVKATAKGRLDNLTVNARVTSASLAQKDLRLTGVRADVDLRRVDVARLPGPAVGEAEVHIANFRKGGKSYGKADVVATVSDGGRRADIRFQGGGVDGFSARGAIGARLDSDGGNVRFDGARVSVSELRVATRDLVWQAKGGRLEVTQGGRRLGGDLAFSSAAGSVRVVADLTRSGDDFRGPVRFQIGRLDVARVLAQFGVTGLRGRVAGEGEVQLPAGPGQIRVEAKGVSWPGAPQPLNGQLRADLASRRLTGHADIDAGKLGRIAADVVVRTPASLTDAAAWKRLRPDAVESLQAKADDVDLARLAHEAGSAARLRSGVANLELEAGRGLDTGRLSLNMKGVELVATTELIIPITASVEAKLERRELTAWAKVDAGDQGKIELDAAATMPARPFEAAGWRGRGLDALQSARLRVTDVSLDRLQPNATGKRVRRSLRLTGMVQADITATQGAQTLAGRIDFRDVRMIEKASPLAGELTLQVQPRSTDVALAVRLPGGPLLDGAVSIGLGADQVRGLDFSRLGDRLRAASLRGQLRVPNQPVVRLAAALDTTPKVSGQLSGELTARGTVGKPNLVVRVGAPGFTAEGVRFDQLALRGDYRAGPWTVNIDARQSDGGRVDLDASGSPDRRAPLKVHLAVGKLRLGLFTPLWKRPGGMLTYLDGMLDASLDISGTTAEPVLDGNVKVRGAEARIAQFLRPVTNGALDVVFRRSQIEATLTADSRPGKLRLEAKADFRRPAQASFQGRLLATRLPIQAGTQLVSINGNVGATGRLRGPMWQVKVQIERGVVVRLPSQKGMKLHDSGPLDDVVFVDAAGAAQQAAREELKRAAGPAMVLDIVSDDLVEVRSDEVRLDMRIKLKTTQVGGVTVVDGNVEAVRGWIEIVGRRYTIERGWVSFAGEIPPDPRLDIRVSHQFPDALVYIDVSGRVSRPQVTFASDAGTYDQAQLLGMILGGEGGAGAGDRSLSERAQDAAQNVVASQVAGVIRQAGLPVDALRVGQEDDQSRYITVGKWLSERLFVAYSFHETNETDKNRNEVTFQHFFTRDWMWEGATGDRGETSIDLLWIVPLGR